MPALFGAGKKTAKQKSNRLFLPGSLLLPPPFLPKTLIKICQYFDKKLTIKQEEAYTNGKNSYFYAKSNEYF